MSVQFVRDEELGWGRSIPGDDSLRFFDSPALPEKLLPRIDRTFRQRRLPAQQRVWWYDGDRWIVGRVVEPNKFETEYRVDFPNKRSEWVPTGELRVRWSLPLADPLGLIKAGTVETRFFHTKRTAYVREVSAQRTACLNLRGLLSSAVAIYEHQLGAARRVLSDPVPRYLLADEVGLGKTIEAGMIIRQLMLDEAGRVSVLVPDHLVGQWEAELDSKFRVSQLPGDLEVVGHSDLDSLTRETRALLVVDEVHQFTEGVVYTDSTAEAQTYATLSELAHSADALLLLSATPVRSNEDAFLGILHLLDPHTYSLDDLEGFRHRVEMRDELAEALSAIGEETPLRYLADPLAQLQGLLPHDTEVNRLTRIALAGISQRDIGTVSAAVDRVRVHVSESYRLHRRMIRNRRSGAAKADFPVRGRAHGTSWLLEDPDRRRREVASVVEALRIELNDLDIPNASRIFQIVLGRSLAPISALQDLAAALRGRSEHDLSANELAGLADFVSTPMAMEIARQIELLLGTESEDDRFSAVVDWCRLKVGRGKYAIACSYPRTAANLTRILTAEFGSHRVTGLLETQSDDQRTALLSDYTRSTEQNLLVCDRSVEEGMNLQFISEVLHVNLPTVTSQLEQRLGRFDRWSELDQPVRSTTFREADSSAQESLGVWLDVLNGPFDVFRTSTSMLQYVLSDVEAGFFEKAVTNGLPDAGQTCVSQYKFINEQRRRITSQDLLDSVEDRSQDEELADAVAGVDRQTSSITSSVVGYIHDMLGFAVYQPDAGRIRFSVSKSQPPLLPDMDIRSLGTDALQRPYTADRTDVRHGEGFLRFGEPLIDRFAQFAEEDDRGRAFAVELAQKYAPDRRAELAFCFDYTISPDLSQVAEIDGRDSAFARAVRSRTAKFLPATVERVWWLSGKGEYPAQTIQYLEKQQGENLGSRPERFRELMSEFDWPSCCEDAQKSAIEAVMTRQSVTQHTARARDLAKVAAERDLGILAVRSETAGIEIDKRVFDAVADALEHPTVQLESCGAVFITWDQRK